MQTGKHCQNLSTVSKCVALLTVLVLVAWNMHLSQRLKHVETGGEGVAKTDKSVAVSGRLRHAREASENEGNENEGGENEENSSQGNNVDIRACRPGGATYVRWGRKTCGETSDLVYVGQAGGSWYDHTGGASNYLCLPSNPIWNKGGGAGARIYGAEYKAQSQFKYDNNDQSSFINQNVPCAVCRSSRRSSVLMVPARNVCHEGWTLEYQGYLMTGGYASRNNYEYVCMDEAPECQESGFADQKGALFHFVKAMCGSLDCPNYEAEKVLTCAVCTK